MSKFFEAIRLPAVVVGLILLFITERYLGGFALREMFLGISVALLVIAFGSALINSFMAKRIGLQAESTSWKYAASWHLAILLGVVAYFGFKVSIGDGATPDTPIQKVLMATYLLFFIVPLFAAFGIEWAHSNSGRGVLADSNHVKRSGASWLLVGLLTGIIFAVNYTAATKDKTYDLSYLKATAPGSSTTKMVLSLTEPVEVSLFYPSGNEVLQYVEEYFEKLGAGSDQLLIKYYDVDLHPGKAEDYRVSRNGIIVLSKGEKRERIDTRLELSKARSKLKKLDQDFQKAFLKLSTSKKTAYFSRGHGEMKWTYSSQIPFSSLRWVEAFLRQQQYNLKFLDLESGSAKEIPEDASVVVIAGPTQPFLAGEINALQDYIGNGGKIMVFVDPMKARDTSKVALASGNDPLISWLSEIGLQFQPKMLANDKAHISFKKAKSDRAFLFTNVFTSHESVANLAKHDEKIPVIMYRAGYFDVKQSKEKWKVFETVRSLGQTFVDTNKNFEFDKDSEKRDTYVLGAAAVFDTGKKEGDLGIEGRLYAYSDASALSDELMGSPGNKLLFHDSLKWLMGESEFSGEISSEEDIKLRHTSNEDKLLFFSTIFGVPSFVILAGFVATRRRRKGGRV